MMRLLLYLAVHSYNLGLRLQLCGTTHHLCSVCEDVKDPGACEATQVSQLLDQLDGKNDVEGRAEVSEKHAGLCVTFVKMHHRECRARKIA